MIILLFVFAQQEIMQSSIGLVVIQLLFLLYDWTDNDENKKTYLFSSFVL